jgi:ABC-type uncharacterized transport system involved in gliding motility auxiliary subunit
MNRYASWFTLLAVALAILLLMSVNVLAGRLLAGWRFDLTDQQLYTLSAGTKTVLAKIDEPITLKLYYSKRLGQVAPSYGVYAERVEELLRDYQLRTQGKIRFEILDPQPFSEVEDQATAAGLQGVTAEEGGEQVYFGLVGTNSTDDTQTIPFFQQDREKFVEYDLTKLIQTLAFPKKKVVGLVTALTIDGDPMAQMQGRPSHPIFLLEQMRESFDVRDLAPSFDTIPDDVDVLMIVQPESLPPKTEYAIDQFVLKGGHALVFVDPNSEYQQAHPSFMTARGTPPEARFDKLLKAWGVELTPGKVVGDQLAALAVNTGNGEAADYLGWLRLKGDDLNADDPVTADLSQMILASAGALAPVKDAKTKFEPLLRSSAQSELIDADRVRGLPDVLALLGDFKSTDTRYVLAARVTGPADTAFPDGPPKDDKPKDDKAKDPGDDPAKPDAPKPAGDAAQVKSAKQPIDVIVVADSDLLDDRFWVQVSQGAGQRVAVPTSNNGDFVLNALDSLTGTGDLIGLRSRGSAVRPFEVVDQMQRLAEDKYRTREKELKDKLQETETKLSDLRSQEDSSGKEQLTPDQQQAVDQFSATIIRTRTELRQVQLALRQDIDALKETLVLLNVALVPFCVAVVAVIVGIIREQRRKRRVRTA